MAQRVKHLPATQETLVQSLGREDPLEKEMATHSGILAWKIPWTESTKLDMNEQLHFLSFNSILTIICSSHDKLILKKKINHWPSITTGYVFVPKLVEIVGILKTKKANTQIKMAKFFSIFPNNTRLNHIFAFYLKTLIMHCMTNLKKK